MTTETILTDDDIKRIDRSLPHNYLLTEFARAIEQAVLQSPEVQALRKDAGRYHEIRSRLTGQSYDPSFFDGLFMVGCMGHPDDLDREIDAHMEK